MSAFAPPAEVYQHRPRVRTRAFGAHRRIRVRLVHPGDRAAERIADQPQEGREQQGADDRAPTQHPRSGRGPVPQLRSDRRNAQHADIGIVRSAPPHVIGAFPDFGRLGMIATYCGLRRDRKIGFGVRIDEHEADSAIARDLVLLGAAQICDKPDGAAVAIGPRFQGPRAQTRGRAGSEHAHADTLDDVPDAVE